MTESPAQTDLSDQLDELWQAHSREPSAKIREELVHRYLYLARSVALRMCRRLPGSVEPEDLFQDGFFGLHRAVEAFDPGRGVKFTTFAMHYIRGAILDAIRARDWVPRLVRHRSQRVEDARRQFVGESGRLPTEEELASRLGVSSKEFRAIINDSRVAAMLSLRGGRTAAPETDASLEQLPPDPSTPDPTLAIQRRELRDMVTKSFTRTERLIMILYYEERMTMREIGVTLDISESRVSQLHSLLVERVKANFSQSQGALRSEP